MTEEEDLKTTALMIHTQEIIVDIDIYCHLFCIIYFFVKFYNI